MLVPSPVFAAVRITEKGLAHEGCLCEPGTTAIECAAAWEETVPCDCGCHPRVTILPAEVRALSGLPAVGATRAPWVRIQTERGVLMVPQATVDAIEEERAVGLVLAAGGAR